MIRIGKRYNRVSLKIWILGPKLKTVENRIRMTRIRRYEVIILFNKSCKNQHKGSIR